MQRLVCAPDAAAGRRHIEPAHPAMIVVVVTTIFVAVTTAIVVAAAVPIVVAFRPGISETEPSP